MTLEKQRIVVTGASRGIGRAILDKLLTEGYEVIPTCRSIESIPAELSSIKWLVADYNQPAEFEQFLSDIEKIDRIDGLINNAGINRIKPLDEVDHDDYNAVLRVNLETPYFLAQKVIPKMKNGGRVVNIASIWATVTKPERSLYSTVKAGLTGMTRAMAAEFGPRGILVNAVSPGFTKTALTDRSLSKKEQADICEVIPLRRMAEVSEIANLVCFLVSHENTYITGQNILIDGGFSIV